MNHSELALHTDRYELTMLNAALIDGTAQRKAVFEVFARFLPPGRDVGIVVGTERVADAIVNFRFTPSQVTWLVGEAIVNERFADYLFGFSFNGSVYGYAEGETYLAHSPVLRVEGSFAEGVVLETLVLSILNHDTAVASTAAQMVRAAQGRRLIEMGSRRTHDESAVHAARAAYIAGFDSTSNLEAGYRYGVPTAGTASHAWVLAHENEYDAFVAQIEAQGVATTLLVDTFDIDEGIVTAVKAANHFGSPGPGAIRIDSGDLETGAFAARALLDSLGARETGIVATGDLDERRIADLVGAGAPVDAFGVGTRVVTGANCPSPGFVYKLVAIGASEGTMRPVAKRSLEKQDRGGTTYVRRLSAREARRIGLAVDDGSSEVEVLFVDDPVDDDNPSWSQVQHRLIDGGTRVGADTPVAMLRERTVGRLNDPAGFVQRPR
ncbi:MAG: nicotinate phosphoribosyltransferase [Acidimicrobiales bacterium]|jgi:nicotinate phosphoribosyltransferase